MAKFERAFNNYYANEKSYTDSQISAIMEFVETEKVSCVCVVYEIFQSNTKSMMPLMMVGMITGII